MDLPKQTEVNKIIPKNKFYDKGFLKSKLAKEYINYIQKIIWKNKIAENTIWVKPTDKIQEIQIFEIVLKQYLIPKNVLNSIDKHIPYPILYILNYNGNICYWISIKNWVLTDYSSKYYFTEWNEKIEISFNNTNLEELYKWLIKKFIKSIDGRDLEFAIIIETDDKISILSKEIKQLKIKIKNEKQFNKKVELNKILQEKQKQLKSIFQ